MIKNARPVAILRTINYLFSNDSAVLQPGDPGVPRRVHARRSSIRIPRAPGEEPQDRAALRDSQALQRNQRARYAASSLGSHPRRGEHKFCFICSDKVNA